MEAVNQEKKQDRSSPGGKNIIYKDPGARESETRMRDQQKLPCGGCSLQGVTSEAGEGQDHQGFFKMLRLYPASKGKMKSLKCFLTGRDREEGYDQTKILETSAVGGEPDWGWKVSSKVARSHGCWQEASVP